MPRETAADRVLTRLVGGNGREAHEASQRLQWGNFDTIDHVLAAIDAGAQVPVHLAAELGNMHRVNQRAHERWDINTVFDDDAGFTTQRLVLLLRPRFGALPPGMSWEPVIAQMRRMWRAGRVQDPYIFLPLAFGAMQRAHTRFAIEVLAHTPYDEDFVAHKAQLHSDAAVKFVARHWRQVETLRARLFRQVWLPGQVSKTERQALRQLPKTLVYDLYGNLATAGYDGYATHIFQQRQAR